MHLKNIIIFGLGNYGTQYKKTRHNFGERFVEFLNDEYGIQKFEDKKRYFVSSIEIEGIKVFLVKGKEYMNLSILPLKRAMKDLNVKTENVFVAFDEIELLFGCNQIKFGGGAAGHNGLRSIIQVLGKDFYRIRLGIGYKGRNKKDNNLHSYVLERFNDEEEKNIVSIFKSFKHSVQNILSNRFCSCEEGEENGRD